MNPSANSPCRWKIRELRSYLGRENANNHLIPFVAITETWLKSHITDAQIQIPQYVVSRSDRCKKIGGGVALFSHESIPISDCIKYDDITCQAIFCRFDTIKSCIVLVYRPPSSSEKSFIDLIGFISHCMIGINDDSYELNLVGDFNFPDIDWVTSTVLPGDTKESRHSAELLLSFISKNLLNQYVHVPTRGNNTLDLFISSNPNLVTNVSNTETNLSDHDLVDITISYNPTTSHSTPKPNFEEDEFRSLDFNKANFEDLRTKLDHFDYLSLRTSCSFEEFPELADKFVI